jgi:hypothetical protein|tara:strand:- start:443 stop:601 length:159 start_codon:yes stop_codon:yes gene_type:complete
MFKRFIDGAIWSVFWRGGERAEFTIPKIVSWLLGANFNELEVNIMVKTYFWY